MTLFEKFIEKSKNKFGDQFDYSKVNYINAATPIILICKKHGEFITTPLKHLHTKYGGCKKCKPVHNKYTQKEFIKKCKEKWGNYFSYDHVIYTNIDTKVLITCPLHGDFLSRPADFLRGHSCPKCKSNLIKLKNKKLFADSKESFIQKCELKYPGLFNYDSVIYVNSRTKILLYSNILQEYFYALPSHVLQGTIKKKYLNQSLNWNKPCKNTEAFIQESKFIHGQKYLYNKCIYKNCKEPVIITCLKHGDFLISPIDHTSHRQGCPKCNQSKGESLINLFLQDRNLDFQSQYPINVDNHTYKIDFCLFFNKTKIFIEYNGKQHY